MHTPEHPNNPAPKQPVSEARRAASRANGAKSRGPVTPEGKQRSSRNAVKHGILASVLTLSDGDAALFESLHQNYIQRFSPRDQPEHDLIEEAVYAKWQMRQAWMIHARTLNIQMLVDFENVGAEWDPISTLDRHTLAFAKSLKESNVLPTLQRYTRQLSTQAERAIKLFMQLHAQRLPPSEPIDEPNEPEPPQSAATRTQTTDPRPLTTNHSPLATRHSPLARPLTTAQPNEPEPPQSVATRTQTTDPRPLTTNHSPLVTRHSLGHSLAH